MTDNPLTTVDALSDALETPPIDPVLLTIANEYLQGKSVQDISERFNISTDRVIAVIEQREVKQYIDNTISTQGYLNRQKRVALINKVIEEKVEKALTEGEFSKKDLLDWIKLLNDLDKQINPKEAGPKVAIQVNNYDKLMSDLLDH